MKIMDNFSMEKKEKTRASVIRNRVFTGIGITVCVLLLALLIWVCTDRFIRKSPVTEIFGYSAVRVLTGSMSGTANEGDLVIIKDTGDYTEGDIITFLPEGDKIPTTHRIVGIDEDGKYITRGDANNTEDTEHISRDRVIGEVVKIFAAGAASAWFLDMGWIYLLTMVIIAVGGVFLLKYDSKLSNDAKENAPSDTQETQETQEPQETQEMQSEDLDVTDDKNEEKFE